MEFGVASLEVVDWSERSCGDQLDPKVCWLNTVVSGILKVTFTHHFSCVVFGEIERWMDLPRRRRHHSARNSEEWEARGGLFAWIGVREGAKSTTLEWRSVSNNGLLAVSFHTATCAKQEIPFTFVHQLGGEKRGRSNLGNVRPRSQRLVAS